MGVADQVIIWVTAIGLIALGGYVFVLDREVEKIKKKLRKTGG